MLKLGFLAVICVAIFVSVGFLSWGYFYCYQPDVEEAKLLEAQAVALHTNGMGIKKAQDRVNTAVKMYNEKVAEWAQIAAVKTPPASLPAGGINMGVNAYQMTIDARVFRNSIQKALNKQLKVGGVKVINGPMIPFPSEDANAVVSDFFNYPAFPFPVVVFDLGQVTVQGTYGQIKTNMEAWTNMPNYLAVADGLVLTGTSPILTGTYNLTLVGYIRSSVVYNTVQLAGATEPVGGAGKPASRVGPRGNGGAPPPPTGPGGGNRTPG